MGIHDEEILSNFSYMENRGARGDVRLTCPDCSNYRAKKGERCLSVKRVDDGAVLYSCKHCGLAGAIQPKRSDGRRTRTGNWGDQLHHFTRQIHPVTTVPVDIPSGGLSEKALTYLASRGISKATTEKYGLFSAVKWFRARDWAGEAEGIGFPYRITVGSDLTAAKYRALDMKAFTQDGAARTFFGIQHVSDGSQPLVICEGELDSISMAEAGVPNAVSVPSGAPAAAIQDGSGREDRRFGYLAAAADILKMFKKFVLAVDGDAPGKLLAEELSRRLGRAKCYTVLWPEGCKDANDVLRSHGKDALVGLVKDAQPWPVVGIQSALHYADKVRDLYTNGLKPGLSTGVPGLDPLFTICPGQISVVTGVPAHGKTELVDQIMMNLAMKYDWRFAVWSIENPPHMHITKLAEKYLQLPFRDGPTPRMRPDELDRAMKFIDEHFIFMEQADGGTADIESILDRAAAIVLRNGARGLVIDPFNYIDMGADRERQDLMISDMLTKVRMFALAYEAHVWFVAHPKKMYKINGETPVPDGYDIGGSSAWFSKADIGFTVHREKNSTRVLIRSWKCRFKWIGAIGDVYVSYDPITGTYFEDVFSPE